MQILTTTKRTELGGKRVEPQNEDIDQMIWRYEAWKATSALEKAESDYTDGVRTILRADRSGS
jgi:hypothetical protein